MTDIFTRIAPWRTADEVVQQIEALILEGVLRVGDRLPGERDLSRRLDVSRPILRAALKTLEQKGLLSTRAGDGTRVADVVGRVFAEPVADLIANHPKAAADYMEYRRDIETVAAEHAARRATGEDRAMLADIMARMEEAHSRVDFEAEARIDVEFHNAIGECAHNMILLHTLRACYRLLADEVFYNRFSIYNLPGAREALLSQHRAIHEAVAGGDAPAARRAAGEHIDFVESAMAQAARSDEWRRVSRLRYSRRIETPVAVQPATEQQGEAR
ncbi:MAG: FadR family transcriptional regulator [Rhizobiaceae bacterium]|nr:FadR family transcriptional regulator [Rhizobiaceae bacterium]MCV0406124.1 FadR family transcriptional regulator [Rhizobiaceae bacterium]